MKDTQDPLDSEASLVHTLVDANHILFSEGVLDGFGHVSVRSAQRPDCFLIARSMAPALVGAADITWCGLDGVPRDTQGRRAYVERFIHSEIYRARPEVQAIVHSHSPTLIPFGATGTRLRPICHMSGFLGSAGSPVFEIRDIAGDASDLLVSDARLGQGLAATLGASSMVLMRGHGNTTVGSSLPQVVYRAIYAESNARLQWQAMSLGEVNYLSEQEAERADATGDLHLDRAWQLWRAKARQHVQDLKQRGAGDS